jgi:hypothetical protein
MSTKYTKNTKKRQKAAYESIEWKPMKKDCLPKARFFAAGDEIARE